MTLAPRAASGKLTGTVTVRFLPRRPKTGMAVGVHDDVEVAGGPAAAARPAPGLDPDALAVLDAGGDADLDLAGPVLDAQRPGRSGRDARPACRCPPQVWQGWLKENRPWLSLMTPRPPQIGQTTGTGARRRAGTAAGVAGRLGGDVDGGGDPVDGVEERQVQAGLRGPGPAAPRRCCPGAAARRRRRPVAPAEDVAEQVAEVVDVEVGGEARSGRRPPAIRRRGCRPGPGGGPRRTPCARPASPSTS